MATVIVRQGELRLRRGGATLSWSLSRFIWLQASGHKTRLHTLNGTELVSAGLASFAHWLPRDQFARINRSVIVNRQHVRSTMSGVRGRKEVLLSDGTRLIGTQINGVG